MKTKFIIIEGGEGTGKTTMLNAAREIYGEQLVFSREPGGSPFGEDIRHLALKTEGGAQANAFTQFCLVWASRSDHMKNIVLPALEAGKHVLCDRFDSSTWTYQICGQEGHHIKELFWQMRDKCLGEVKPDLYIYLDVDPKVGLARRNGQQYDDITHFDTKPLEFHQRVREGYLEFMKTVPSRIIDAHRPLDEVKEEFCRVLRECIAE